MRKPPIHPQCDIAPSVGKENPMARPDSSRDPLAAHLLTVVASLAMVACGGGGSGDTTTVASASGSATHAGVGCSYSYSAFITSPSVNASSTVGWSCDSGSRTLSASGIPDHGWAPSPTPAAQLHPGPDHYRPRSA